MEEVSGGPKKDPVWPDDEATGVLKEGLVAEIRRILQGERYVDGPYWFMNSYQIFGKLTPLWQDRLKKVRGGDSVFLTISKLAVNMPDVERQYHSTFRLKADGVIPGGQYECAIFRMKEEK